MTRVRILSFAMLITLAMMPSTPAQESDSGARADCACPVEGRWNAQNLEGSIDCKGSFALSRKLKPEKDNGVIFVMEHHCASLFGDSMTKSEEDVLMTRVDGCVYEGTIAGEEEGIEMVIEMTWSVENEKQIRGEMSSSTSQMGMTCDFYRPFELTFDKELSEPEYQKLKNRVAKKVEKLKSE